MFPTTRSHLIVVTQTQPQSQFVAGPPPQRALSLVVPGVPESSDAYLVTPTGLRPLQHRRVTGGCGVSIDEMGHLAAIVFTSDPLVYARLAQTAARNRQRVAKLQLALARSGVEATQRVLVPLAAARRTAAPTPAATTLVQTTLAQAERALAAGDAPAAFDFAQQAERTAAQWRRTAWQSAVGGAGTPMVHPALASFE
jgi:hypothetical protein